MQILNNQDKLSKNHQHLLSQYLLIVASKV